MNPPKTLRLAPDANASASGGAVPAPCIPDHALLRRIGEGSYGEVWLARNIMGSYRAVKVVYRRAFEYDRPYEREFNGIQKFEPISRLHESQVDILHIGRNDVEGYFYYVMELADDEFAGQQINPDTYQPRTLKSELLKHPRIPFEDCLRFSLSLTTALGHLHQHSLIHRDIKPSNIIFVNDVPKLADIGLVTDSGSTVSFVGTEGYVPPEGPGTPQADLYSLGMVLYEMSMGLVRTDFPQLPPDFDQLANRDELLEISAIIGRACDPDARRRYASTDDMRRDLALLLAGKSVKRLHATERRLKWLTRLGAAAACVGLSGFGAFYFVQKGKQETLTRELAVREEKLQLTSQLETALNQLKLRQAEELLAGDKAALGIAHLARALRANPTNRLVAERLMSALSQRRFARLIHEMPDVTTETRLNETETLMLAVISNRTAQIVDLRTGQPFTQSLTPDPNANYVRWSLDGQRFATVSADRVVRIWDVMTGQAICEIRAEPGQSRTLEFSADHQRLLAFSTNSACVWNAETGEILTRFRFERMRLTFAKPNPDGRSITIHCDLPREQIQIWDVGSTQALSQPLVHEDPDGETSEINGQNHSPDGRLLVTCATDGTVFTWNARTGERVAGPMRHPQSVSTAYFSADGRRIVTICDNQTAQVWDARTGESLTEPLQHKGQIHSARLSPDGGLVVTASSDRSVRLWDVGTGRQVIEPLWHETAVRYARLSADGRNLMTLPVSGPARIWDLNPGAVVPLRLGHKGVVSVARFTADGERVVLGTPLGHVIIESLSNPTSFIQFQGHHGSISQLDFAPDGRTLLTASHDNTSRLWSLADGRPIGVPMTHKDWVRAATFAGGGRWIVTASDDRTMRLWDTAVGTPIGKPVVLNTGVSRVRSSPDGRWIVTTMSEGAWIWDAQTLLSEKHPMARLDSANWVEFDAAGARIVTGGKENAAMVRSVPEFRPLLPPLKHSGAVFYAEFSRDGRHVVTASGDNTGRVWDAATGRPVTDPLQHDDLVSLARFSPDGRRVVTASRDFTARIWDAETGHPVSEPLRHERRILGAEFSPDGRRLLTWTGGEFACVWDILGVPAEIPDWLPDLAETLVRQRISEQSLPEPVQTMKPAAKPEGDDVYSQWARWFLDQSRARTVSPFSTLTVEQYGSRLTDQNTINSLREAIRLVPSNGLARARLAQRLMEGATTNASEADVLSRSGIALAPHLAEVWLTRAEVLEQTERWAEAIEAIKLGIERSPEKMGLWHRRGRLLAKGHQWQEAYQSYSQALELVDSAHGVNVTRKDILLDRAATLRQMDRYSDAVADVTAALGIPARDPHATRYQIDLSSHYNDGLTGSLFNGRTNDFNSLPTGLQRLAGVAFDIRAQVKLADETPDTTRPAAVRGIPIGFKCRRIHFLHAARASGSNRDPWQIGSFIFHHANGDKHEMPIVHGKDVADWWKYPDDSLEVERSAVAWIGSNPAVEQWGSGTSIRLFKSTWENPLPEVELRSLDYESTRIYGGPFLIAITAE